MKISVITVCYNAARFIERAAESVCGQSFPDLEWVVIDGGSTDGTLDILSRFRNRISHLESGPDCGIFHAMNKGIRATTGDVIFFLNADDTFADSTILQDVATIFRQHPGTDLIFGDQLWDGETGHSLVDQGGPVTKHRLARRTIQHQTIFARRSLFDNNGIFDETLRIVGDYDWILKTFLVRGCNSIHMNRVISVMHTGGVSWTSDFEAERRIVMARYFSPAEIFVLRTVPLFCEPLTRRVKIIGHYLGYPWRACRRLFVGKRLQQQERQPIACTKKDAGQR